MTSHDVVGYLRRKFQPRKIGHGGTLDPVACGVLVCLVNDATKRSSEISGTRKIYLAEAAFGIKTDTGDLEGRVIETGDVNIEEKNILETLERFTGEIEQIPPMTSAIKVGGKPLYKLARKGLEIERAVRKVTIYSLRLRRFSEGPGRPAALFEVECSGGTYVRTLVEDIGRAMGAPAVTSFLERMAVGPFRVEDAVNPDEVSERHLVDLPE